jgi:hypothetical protein
MKGMDTSLVFAIIFASIVISLLVVFGGGQIAKMFCFNGIAQVDRSVRDLESKSDYVFKNLATGSSDNFKVSLPGGSKICIVDPSSPGPTATWFTNPDMQPLIENRIRYSNSNVWIVYGCGDDTEYKIANLRLAPGQENFCATSGDSIFIENTGDYVAASIV